MKVKYKGFTLITNFSGAWNKIKTTVVELKHTFEDISQAVRYIDSL